MPRKIMIELEYHPAVLAVMCQHAWDDMENFKCPTGEGLKCPFTYCRACCEVTEKDWKSVCAAEEEKSEA